MSSGLIAYIDNNIKSTKNYFCYRGKYRTLSWSFNKVYNHALRFAGLLRKLGVAAGDRVIIKGKNRPEWVAAYLGCLIRGVVVVPLDVNSSDDFDRKVRDKVNPKLAVCGGSENKFFGVKSIGMRDFEECLSSMPPFEHKKATIGAGTLAQIVFTSGTTAEPKGVMITHRNIEANLKSILPVMDRWKNFFRLMWKLKILSVVPLSHMYGQLIGIYVPIMIGSSVVFTDSVNPRDLVKAVKEEKVWILGTLPVILELLKDYIIKNFNLDSAAFEKKYNMFKKIKWPLRFIAFLNIHLKLGWRLAVMIVGGAAFDSNLDKFWRCIAYTIFQGYGLTEAAPLITLADPARIGAGSIGSVLEGQQVRLAGGEIYVKGDNVTPGYYKDPGLTKKTFSEGWFRTGDLAEMDKNGNMYFKGRKDEVIVRQDGINIYPEDIESVLKTFKSVKDCAVVGLKQGGNIEIHAALILKGGYGNNPGKAVESANKKLTVYQHINSCSIWEGSDFPRTATGKIKKNEVLKALYQKRKPKEAAVPKIPGQSYKIMQVISSLHKIKPENFKKKAELEKDLGLDSLDLIQLAGAIEQKYDMELDDSLITGSTTVGELESLIRSPGKESRRMPFYSLPFRAPVKIIRMIFQYILYPFMSLIYRLKVEGRENLKNLEGPVVFASNHSSHLDTFVILYSLPPPLRNRLIVLMSIEYHFNHFFYGTGIWLRRAVEALGFYLLVNLFISACPLSRIHGFRQSMENIGKLISRGWSILIYPEGRVTTDGNIKDFEPGAGVIASDMEVSVVPVRIRGLFNILRNGILPWGHLPGWPLVRVSFGQPLKFKSENYRKIGKIIERAVKSL